VGYTSTGGPKGLGVVTDSARTVADLNQIIALLGEVGNTRVGTTGERDALPAAKLYTGLTFVNTTTGTVERYVGGGWKVILEDTGWSALALQNGWGNHSNANYQTIQHRRRNGVVAVEGTIASGTVAPGTVLFVLPAGSRPTKYIVVTIWSNGQARPIEIAPSGNVVVGDTPLSSARTDIAFTFLADQ
jgi:hypothetical protein